MKNLLLLFFTVIFIACNAKKPAIEITPKKIVKPTRIQAKKANATKNNRGYLIGITNKQSLQDPSYKSWFDSRYNEYDTDKEVIAKIKETINDFTIKGFMGTWCGDSRRGVPRFYKILEETGFDQNYFELISVGRNKKTPDNLQEGFDLIRVPTYIFLKDGKEVGRYVERPRENLEKDILKIITGQPYKHSYDRSK